VAGEYSIADMLIYPWLAIGYDLIKSAKPEIIGEGAHVGRWLKAVGERPAVQKGMLVPKV
jgi:GST-like protein